MREDNPEKMTASERLDWILDSPFGGEDLAALPVSDDQTIRQAIRHSIDANGIQATGEHWAAVIETIGPVPKLYLDTIEVIFNQEVSEVF